MRGTYRTTGIEKQVSNLLGDVLEEDRTVDALSSAMVEALESPVMEHKVRLLMAQSAVLVFGSVLVAYVVGRMIT